MTQHDHNTKYDPGGEPVTQGPGREAELERLVKWRGRPEALGEGRWWVQAVVREDEHGRGPWVVVFSYRRQAPPYAGAQAALARKGVLPLPASPREVAAALRALAAQLEAQEAKEAGGGSAGSRPP